MSKCDLKSLFSGRTIKTALIAMVVIYVLVFQLFYNRFWRSSYSRKFMYFSNNNAPWLQFWKGAPDEIDDKTSMTADVHIEDKVFGHTGIGPEVDHNHTRLPGVLVIAIGGGITSKGLDKSAAMNISDKFQLFSKLLPSFCNTASVGLSYHFYLAYDSTDGLFKDTTFLAHFQKSFFNATSVLCAHLGPVWLHMIQCSHSGKPAWAQNDAMMEAYLDNVDYHYRINDDTIMKTGNWTSTFIDVLNKLEPRNVGVTGPKHSGGNVGILTYDFVHRTHIDVFGYYYPRIFTDWFADGWITRTYRPDRCIKVDHVHLVHTLSLGQRYHVQGGRGNLQPARVQADKEVLDRYIDYVRGRNRTVVNGKKVISMSLFGKHPKYTWGAIRNAQLAPIFFPGWKLRIYVPFSDNLTSSTDDQELLVPVRILNKLKQLGAELAYVKTKSIPPVFWRYLVVDDSGIDYFIVRNAHNRLSERDAIVVNEWLQHHTPNQDLNYLHCIRDHPDHVNRSIVDGLWGGYREGVRRTLKRDMAALLRVHHNSSKNGSVSQEPPLDRVTTTASQENESTDLLNDVIWSTMSSNAYCHDSVSCWAWSNAHKFPVERRENEYLGQEFDEYQEPLPSDNKLLKNIGNRCTSNR